MSGAIVDTLVTLPRRRRARDRGVFTPEISYVGTNAGHLRYIDTGGNKPVVVTTPDGPCVIEHYQVLIEELSANFRVICFDMPGIGFSFPSSRYRFGIAESADVVVEMLDALAVSRAVVAFSCVNGLIAMNLAKRYPNRVSHLVLAQTPRIDDMRKWADRNIPSALRIPYLGQIVGAIGTKYLATNWFNLSLPRSSEHKGHFVDQARKAIQLGGCFCLASLVQGSLRGTHEDVTGFHCPTLMIHGDSDFSHKHTDFRLLTDSIPQAHVETFEECGHFPNLERNDEYVQRLQAFVLNEAQQQE